MPSAAHFPSEEALPKLGIIAGATELPIAIARACREQGREVFVLALEDACDHPIPTEIPHEWTRLGAIGSAISTLKQEGVRQLVLAGKVRRPKLASLRPDFMATKLLARLGSGLLKGDDELLRTIISFLEEQGFMVIGVDDAMSELIAPEGMIGSVRPDKRAQADIEYGVRMAKGVGALDIGQAVIVQNHQVLGVEAIEGTDALIERCAALRVEERGGVLVKVKKPKQERRVDLPIIGAATVEHIARAGFSGIAIEAGSSLILDRRALIRAADELGVFVVGFTLTADE